MKHYGILGHPLKHTMSPYLHEALFRLSGKTDAEYAVYDFAPNELAEKREFLRSLDGLNITIPYKIEMLSCADRLSRETELFQSVNCFANQDGTVVGYNTDVDGFLRAVAELGGDLSGKVLLLGAGGVAQTIAVAAAEAGAELCIAVRESDLGAARNLAERVTQFGKPVRVTTTEQIGGTFDLLINATPVGMYPRTDASPVPEQVVKNVKAVFDAVYNPKETELYRIAKSLRIPAATGMSMLVYQAVKAHEIWYGAKFRAEDVRNLIADASKYMEETFR